MLRRRDPAAEMSVFEHLDELRSRLFKMLIAFAVACVGAWFLNDYALGWLVDPLKDLPRSNGLFEQGKLIFTSPPEALVIKLKVTTFLGFFISLPVTLWQIWRFITPGLYKNEKRYALAFVATSMLLFVLGAGLALSTLPAALRFLVAIGGAEFVLVPRASEYLSFVLMLVFAFGATFEFPLILIFLSMVGVVDVGSLRRQRRLAAVVVAIMAAVVTPTQDPLTMTALALPLYLLYELTILVVWLLNRRRITG